MTRFNTVFTFAFITAVFFTANSTVAQPPGPQRGPASFEEFDLDGSGTISHEEFVTVRAQRMGERAAQGMPMRGAASAPAFETFDTDGDGELSPDEFTSGQRQHQQERREMMQSR